MVTGCCGKQGTNLGKDLTYTFSQGLCLGGNLAVYNRVTYRRASVHPDYLNSQVPLVHNGVPRPQFTVKTNCGSR